MHADEAEIADRAAAIVGHRVVSLEAIHGAGGYTPALRRIARLTDGSRVFVKAAVNELTSDWLGAERRAYEVLDGAPFIPRYLGSDDRVLVTEDLSHAHWPPPWRGGDLDRVLFTVDSISATVAPTELRSLESSGPMLRAWTRVAEDPQPFLALQVCDRAWFDLAIARLVEADGAPLIGDALVHADLRSDNLCLIEDRVVVIDWPGAARGRADFDVTTFAQSLTVEGGPEPDDVLPCADPHLVAMLAGCFAHHAPLPSVPAHIRAHLHAQLRVTLPWAARLLDLPPPNVRV